MSLFFLFEFNEAILEFATIFEELDNHFTEEDFLEMATPAHLDPYIKSFYNPIYTIQEFKIIFSPNGFYEIKPVHEMNDIVKQIILKRANHQKVAFTSLILTTH